MLTDNQLEVMMRKIIWILLSILVVLSACTPRAGAFSDAQVPIEVSKGEWFRIELPSNPTTGYGWEFGTPIDSDYLSLMKSYFTGSDSQLVGAGGAQVWVFQTLRTGTTSVQLEYKHPWEIAEPPEETVTFTVIIH